jgi:hypothetical protein
MSDVGECSKLFLETVDGGRVRPAQGLQCDCLPAFDVKGGVDDTDAAGSQTPQNAVPFRRRKMVIRQHE